MGKVVVIGGGLAGLSAAVSLTLKNIPVILIEASRNPGGRVYSFYDKDFDSIIDNGQHIMMGCYSETLRFLKIINAQQNFYFQEDMEVVFYKSGEFYPLKTAGGIYPFNFIKGILSFRLFSLKERLDLLKFFIQLPVSSVRDIKKYSAEEWLILNNQGENLRRTFWNTFVIGALNTTPSKASALILRNILMRIFFSGRKSSAIIVPSKPLSEAFCVPAVNYLKSKNAEVSVSERILKLETDYKKNKIKKIITNKRVIKDFDNIITAVPLYSLNKILPGMVDDSFTPLYSSILTVHFKTTAELFPGYFIAITDSPIHWIFKHPDHYTIVISSADEFIDKPVNEIEMLLKDEIIKKFNLAHDGITGMKTIKEKRATFIPDINSDNRPGNQTMYNNLFLAGDWTNTRLPSTIEGAILSGINAAKVI